TVLHDVTVAIRPGEIAVLVGRSGSGKSTLLNLIAGIDRPTAGRVLVDGTDLTALDEDRRTRFRRRRIGFVFQFFNLIPLLTVEENLLLPLELNGRADPAGVARARALLARVGLGGRGASPPAPPAGGGPPPAAPAPPLRHHPPLTPAPAPGTVPGAWARRAPGAPEAGRVARPARCPGARLGQAGRHGDAQPRGRRGRRSHLRRPARSARRAAAGRSRNRLRDDPRNDP